MPARPALSELSDRFSSLCCVCGQSSVSCVPILGDTGLLRSLLFLWMEGRGEEELGHQRRAGLGGSAVAFGRVHGDRLRQSLML